MKKISLKSMFVIINICLIYFCLSWIVIRLTSWPQQAIGVTFLTTLLLVSTAIVFIRDAYVDEQDLDVRTLVFRSFIKHLDKPRQISERTFLGPKEPKGYVHVFLSDRERSFQLFFSTTSDDSKANRIARSAFMSLDGCDIVDIDVSKCGMSGFEAVSEALDELYYVSVYRNPHTMHIRVYVCVQTLSQTGRMRESV